MQALIGNYNYYLQMIRDVTGLNEARDASTPDRNSLVGIQKLAAANSNTATRHIQQAMLYLTATAAECLSLRISDIIEYSPTREAFIRAIGAHNVATLEEMTEVHLFDFGIFIELLPDDEEKQILENNIQVAIAQKMIDLDDAIDIREVRNLKMANQLLKVKRRKKLERDQMMQQQNIQAQSQATQAAAQEAAKIEMEKNHAKSEQDIGLEKTKNALKIDYLNNESRVKKELMLLEHSLNMKLQGQQTENNNMMEGFREDRKDQRVDQEAAHKSKLQNQKDKNSVKKFESSGNDIVTGGAGIERFTP